MQSANASELTTDIAVIGGGAAGIGVIASLLKRSPGLRISLIEPADTHYYQPGWTLVGGGAYAQGDTARPMAGLVPPGVEWLRTRVERVDPEARRLLLEGGDSLEYRNLIVCPACAWPGSASRAWRRPWGATVSPPTTATTWRPTPGSWCAACAGGKALFTQPAMPIKCAGAPQKAMYLSCDHWLREGVLQDIEVEFDLAGAALFGVADFVPPLMEYVRKYSAELAFNSNLVKVDGAARKAWFEVKDADGNTNLAEKDFDLLHVVPPQLPPTFVAASGLGDAAGWCEVDPATLQHVRHGEIFALGDVCGTANAKTAAAARKQIVVVAENLLGLRSGRGLPLRYDGYGGCPLTVERGRVVLAEFGYAGKLLPTFPLEPTAASRFAWLLKRHVLPWVYWNAMLKGREWLARPGR